MADLVFTQTERVEIIHGDRDRAAMQAKPCADTRAVVAAYTVKGGRLSVIWTDAVQCVMLLGGGIILYFVALGRIPGGWSAMAAASPTRFHLYHPANDPIAPFAGLVAGSLGLFIFYQATNQVMVQRVFGARSTQDAIIFCGLYPKFGSRSPTNWF